MSRNAAAHASRLAGVARTDAVSGWAAQSKVRALAALVDMGEASPLAKGELRRLLEDVADDPPPGARGAQAQLAAIEALERLDAPPDDEAAKVRRLFDDRPDSERVVEDEWFPRPAPPGWVALFSHDTLGHRRAWYRRLVEEGMLET